MPLGCRDEVTHETRGALHLAPSRSHTVSACTNESHATMLRPSRSEARKKGFKKVIDADEARRKREEGMIQIRKDKREEAFLKKRRCVPRGRIHSV